MPLFVVTNNGLPVTGKKGGGLRIGYAYLGGGVFMPDANVAAYLAILAAQQQVQRIARARELQKEAKQREAEEDRQLQEYLSLPRALGYNQLCSNCRSSRTFPDRKVIGQSSRPIIICEDCENLMRPYGA